MMTSVGNGASSMSGFWRSSYNKMRDRNMPWVSRAWNTRDELAGDKNGIWCDAKEKIQVPSLKRKRHRLCESFYARHFLRLRVPACQSQITRLESTRYEQLAALVRRTYAGNRADCYCSNASYPFGHYTDTGTKASIGTVTERLPDGTHGDKR